MTKNTDSNTSKAFQITVSVVCASILALLGYLKIFHSKKGDESGESLAGQYLITFYGFGCIVFGALSIWAIIDLIETKRRGAVSVCRLVLFCVGFVYLLYKLVNSV